MLSVHKVTFNGFMQNNILLDIKKDKRIKYRSRLDVMAAILEATASGRAIRSSIYNKSFLNDERFRSTMSFLLARIIFNTAKKAVKSDGFMQKQNNNNFVKPLNA